MTRQIFFDTETTGLELKEGHRIVEIGAIEVIDKVATGNFFHCYLNPEGKATEPETEAITHIRDDFLLDKPLFKEVWPEFKAFLSGADQLVAHNAEFDISFLDAEIRRINPKSKPLAKQFEIVDSLVLARHKFPGQRNSLDALCKRYKIDLTQRQEEGHGALLDAKLLFMVYSALTLGEQELMDLDAPEKVITTALEAAPSVVDSDGAVLEPHEIKAHQDFLRMMLEKASNKSIVWQDYENFDQ